MRPTQEGRDAPANHSQPRPSEWHIRSMRSDWSAHSPPTTPSPCKPHRKQAP